MAKCEYCHKILGFFDKHQLNDGAICSECNKILPKGYKLQNVSADEVRIAIDYCRQTKKYEPTSHYGIFGLDEIHGTCKVSSKSDHPIIVNVIDLSHFDIVCTNVHTDKYNKVYCDVELIAEFYMPNMTFRQIIKKNVRCQSKIANSKEVSWSEPAELSMFRNMVDQTYKNMIVRFTEQNKDHFLSKQKIDVFKARCLFMIDDYYDKEILKNTRNALMKSFHPDEGQESAAFAQKISESYDILLNELIRSNHEDN